MKKVFTFMFALVFMTGVAFAQSNDASVDQSGDDNDATIEQIGSQNQADLIQRNFGSSGHVADIFQDGSQNTADVLSQGGVGTNTVDLDQLGTGNETTIAQLWGQNAAEVMQDGSDNVVNLQHRGSFQSSADIVQGGDRNSAVILDVGQTGSNPNTNNDAIVSQTGDDNSVFIAQGVFGGASESVADFTQDGDGNYFETKQVRSFNNSVTGTQVGDDNFYRASLRGSDNTVTMDMVGDANRGSWSIGSLGWPHQPEGNTLTIDVDGDDNYSTGSIKGDYNTVDITQFGAGNRIGSSWYTTDGVVIEGNHNTTMISQTGDSHSAALTQMGDGNTATITQSN